MKRIVFELKINSSQPCSQAVRDFIGAVCSDLKVGDTTAYEIKSALDEVYNNVIEHAYRAQPGPIVIRCFHDHDRLVFIFTDWGRRYDFPKRRRIDFVRIVKMGLSRGLGLPMVYRLMDRVEYRPGLNPAEYNEHILEKFIRPAKEG